MQDPQHGLQAIPFCYAVNETAALGCSLRPLLTYPLQGRTSSRLLLTGNPRPGGEILNRITPCYSHVYDLATPTVWTVGVGLSFAAPYASPAQS